MGGVRTWARGTQSHEGMYASIIIASLENPSHIALARRRRLGEIFTLKCNQVTIPCVVVHITLPYNAQHACFVLNVYRLKIL